jgi:hypothetical protein
MEYSLPKTTNPDEGYETKTPRWVDYSHAMKKN